VTNQAHILSNRPSEPRSRDQACPMPSGPIIPVFHHSTFHSPPPLGGSWGLIVQNKANLRRAGMLLNRFVKEVYEEKTPIIAL